jgi:hypothetical protein
MSNKGNNNHNENRITLISNLAKPNVRMVTSKIPERHVNVNILFEGTLKSERYRIGDVSFAATLHSFLSQNTVSGIVYDKGIVSKPPVKSCFKQKLQQQHVKSIHANIKSETKPIKKRNPTVKKNDIDVKKEIISIDSSSRSHNDEDSYTSHLGLTEIHEKFNKGFKLEKITEGYHFVCDLASNRESRVAQKKISKKKMSETTAKKEKPTKIKEEKPMKEGRLILIKKERQLKDEDEMELSCTLYDLTAVLESSGHISITDEENPNNENNETQNTPAPKSE